MQASGRHLTSPFVLGRVSLSLQLLNSVRLANSELEGACHLHVPSVGAPAYAMVQLPHKCWESQLVPHACGAGVSLLELFPQPLPQVF